MVGDDEEDFELSEDQEQDEAPEADTDDKPEGEEPEGDQSEQVEGQKTEGDAQQEPPAQRKPTRYENRIQALSNQTKEANERSSRLERELAELRAERQRQSQSQAEREEAERVALMTTEEKIQHEFQKLQRQNHQFLEQQRFQAADQADRLAFQSKSSADPRYRKYEAEVEQELQNLRQSRGMNLPREAVLAFLIGQKVLKGQSATKAQAAKAQQNIKRQQTQPTGGRSDAAGRKRGEKSLRDRLDGVTF